MGLIKGSKKRDTLDPENGVAAETESSNLIKGPKVNRNALSSALVQELHDTGKSALLKRGSVSYEAAPVWDSEPKATEQVFEASNEADSYEVLNDAYAQPNAEEELKRIKEDAARIMAHANEESRRIMADAQSKAKKLLDQSKLYVETAHSNAQREGYSQGLEDGRVAANEELRTVMDAARQTLHQISQLHDDLARSMELGLARLAVKIAEKVIAREGSLNYDVVINMVRAQLEKVKERESVVIRVHPSDLENVRSKKEIFSQILPGVRVVEVQADPRVERGSCMIETNLGTVDACISTQLAAIELAFAENPPEEHSDESWENPELPASTDFNQPIEVEPEIQDIEHAEEN